MEREREGSRVVTRWRGRKRERGVFAVGREMVRVEGERNCKRLDPIRFSENTTPLLHLVLMSQHNEMMLI